jgi:hypothetical protein
LIIEGERKSGKDSLKILYIAVDEIIHKDFISSPVDEHDWDLSPLAYA